jgi:hypothetical protein
MRAYFFDGAACALFGFYGATASFSEAVKAPIVANHFLETALENFRAAVWRVMRAANCLRHCRVIARIGMTESSPL